MIGLKKVLKSLYVYLAASMWIGSWGIFAVDQINISIDDFFIKREASASSVLLPGYVMHEKNGVKPLWQPGSQISKSMPAVVVTVKE